MPLYLDEVQKQQVITAANMLPIKSRDAFYRSVANRLAEIHRPSNADVANAITFVLNSRGIATSQFMCDAASVTERRQRHVTAPRRC